MDKDGKRRLLGAGLVILAIVGALCVATMVTAQPQPKAEDTRPQPDQLDIVSYAPPLWASERISDCWHMQDRRNHRNYWLIKIDGQWLGLDAGEVYNG